MDEIWKDIPGYENRYQASSEGKIKSLTRIVQTSRGFRIITGRILKPSAYCKSGHLGVKLESKNRPVHILILITFKGNKPKGTEGMFLDGNPTNIHINNLKWGTKSEIQKLRIQRGSRKFSVKDILDIRRHGKAYRGGQQELAKKYSVSRSMIMGIINKEYYSYVE